MTGGVVLELVCAYNRMTTDERLAFRRLVGVQLQPDDERLDDLASEYRDAGDVELDRLQAQLDDDDDDQLAFPWAGAAAHPGAPSPAHPGAGASAPEYLP